MGSCFARGGILSPEQVRYADAGCAPAIVELLDVGRFLGDESCTANGDLVVVVAPEEVLHNGGRGDANW